MRLSPHIILMRNANKRAPESQTRAKLWRTSRVNTAERRSNRIVEVFPVIIHVPAPGRIKRTRSIDPVKTETRTTTPLRDKYPVTGRNGPESHSKRTSGWFDNNNSSSSSDVDRGRSADIHSIYVSA